jgi:probable F420-dependent oxidoreductase
MLPQTNAVASPSAILRVAEAAEELGFDGVTVHDHIVFNGFWIASGMAGAKGPGDDRDLYEAMETLTFVASRTKRILLAASVIILPLRDPVLFAKQAATLDAFSGGRFVLGVGVGPPLRPSGQETTKLGPHRGNAAKEYEAVNVVGNRGPRTDEYLRAIYEIWMNEHATFSGVYVSFEDIEVFPKPVQKPRPPVLIGGRSDHALRRAARYGDGWNPSQVSARQLAELLPTLRGFYREEGRPGPDWVGINIHSVIADSAAAAHAIADPTAAKLFSSHEEYQRRTIVGSPGGFVSRIEEYRAAGANYVELKPLYPNVDHLIDQMQLISDEVIPAFRS